MKLPITAACIAAALLAGTLLLQTNASADSYITGDADGDGVVSVLDVTCVQRMLARLESADADKVLRADTDGNGLDIADATAIQRYLAEYDDASPVGQTVITPDPTKPTDPTVAETTDPDELPFVPSRR